MRTRIHVEGPAALTLPSAAQSLAMRAVGKQWPAAGAPTRFLPATATTAAVAPASPPFFSSHRERAALDRQSAEAATLVAIKKGSAEFDRRDKFSTFLAAHASRRGRTAPRGAPRQDRDSRNAGGATDVGAPRPRLSAIGAAVDCRCLFFCGTAPGGEKRRVSLGIHPPAVAFHQGQVPMPWGR